jgi:hypothetical protein
VSNQREARADAIEGLQLLSTLQLLKPGMQCPEEPSLLKSVCNTQVILLLSAPSFSFCSPPPFLRVSRQNTV